MNHLVQDLLFLLIVAGKTSFAWIISSPKSNKIGTPSNTGLFAVETVSVESLTDHEKEGALLAESVARWLDSEWMPQEVHVKMGESARSSYISMREDGKVDVMDIMMQVGTDLDKNWKEYDADAFVNPWDVANYVSDYLIQRSGNQGCECSSQIF